MDHCGILQIDGVDRNFLGHLCPTSRQYPVCASAPS
jgi:hypothetical protein